MRRLALLLLPLVGSLLAPGARAEDAVPVLADGVPHPVVMREGRATWTARFDVPAGVRAVAVVASADTDVDLFVKRGQPVLDEFEAEADAFRRGDDGAEVLVLGGEGRPAPQPGAWYVTLEHPRAAFRGAAAEVVVLLDEPQGPRTVLPGQPVIELVGGDHPAALRTFVPRGARSLRVALQGRGVEGSEVLLRGPGGVERRAPATQPVLVETDEIAAGAWTLGVHAAAGAAPRKVTVEVAWTFSPLAAASDAPLLAPGAAQLALLGGDSPHARLYRVEVPDGAGGFVLEQHNDARADIDLYVRRDAPPEIPERDADWLGISSAPTETLVVGGARPLAAGTYFVRVGTYVEGPVLASIVMRLLGPDERAATWGPSEPPSLASGAWVRGRTAPQTSGITWYAVDPPAGVRSLHALLLESSAPLDLLLARRSDGSVLSRAVTGRVDERLDHAFPAPLPADRRFLLGVASLTPGEGPAEFRLALGFDAPPALPSDLLWPQLLDVRTLSPDERVAAATVELTGERSGGGSATCVSPKGLLLSCRHVLEDAEEPGALQKDGIFVAFNRSLDRPPVQCFVARVVHEDAALDMALLELTSDVFGRALPADLAVPWVPLGDSDALRLGDAITVFGYPQDGSEFTRTPVILSRGSVAGFESAAGRRTWIKTDAWIGPGHSGGTLVGPDHRLVAVPAATLGLNQAVGLAVPVGRIPPVWRQRIERDLKLPR